MHRQFQPCLPPPPPGQSPGIHLRKENENFPGDGAKKVAQMIRGAKKKNTNAPPLGSSVPALPIPTPPPGPITGQNDKCPRVGAKNRSNAPDESVIKQGVECPISGLIQKLTLPKIRKVLLISFHFSFVDICNCLSLVLLLQCNVMITFPNNTA